MRKGLYGAAASAVAFASLAGCGAGLGSRAVPTAPPAPSTSGSRSTPDSATPLRVDGPVGSDGLTIRQLGADGKVRTVQVKDFRR